jgi:outer membrane protein OmpA-like peptidoglycan-associated protein
MGQYPSANAPTQPAISQVHLSSLPETVGLEHSDRINRLARLSSLYGINPPQIDQLQINPTPTVGVNYPIPVVRIVFPERVFFDFDRDEIRPDANRVLDLIADNMRRDVPDAQLLLMGHTDAIGSDAYNVDLSRRRALSVMQALIGRGVRLGQLSTIAIGKRQPIAPNDTEEGRARNRRVEFVVSASQAANLELVRRRRIYEDYLKVKPTEVAVNIIREVQIEKPTPIVPKQPTPEVYQPRSPRPLGSTTPGPSEASPREAQRIQPSALGAGSTIATQPVGTIELRQPEPRPELRLNAPAQYEANRLNEEFAL